jgi:hypothetical protein
MMGHHERPGAERHEFPGQQERERVVRNDHKIHAGEERWKEREHAVGRRFMSAVAECIEARCGAPQIDDNEKKSGKRIDAEMGAEPG